MGSIRACAASLCLLVSHVLTAQGPAGVGGTPPLVAAAGRGDLQEIERLLAAGADVKATDAQGATALHRGIHSLVITRRLLDAGAAREARLPNGATPLLVAIGRIDAMPVVDELLARGADPTAMMRDVFGAPCSPLVRAAERGETALVRRLLADERVRSDVPLLGVALQSAAFCGQSAIVDLLVAAGADADQGDPFIGHALNRALYAGHREVALRLLPQTRDLARFSGTATATPTAQWAVYDECGDDRVLRAMIERGVDLDSTSSNGESVRRWAEKRGLTRATELLRQRNAADAGPARRVRAPAARVVPADATARTALRRAGIERALALLQRSSDRFLDNGFVRQQKCISCHQQNLPALAMGRARQRGYRIDEAVVGRQFLAAQRQLTPALVRAAALTDPVPDAPASIGFLALGAHACNTGHDELIEAMCRFLAESQNADGSFASHHRRPPIEEGPITGTALALAALRLYPPHGGARKVEDVRRRAAAWLATCRPESRNQQLFRLLGLGWADTARAVIDESAVAAVAMQGEDGGVAPFVGVPADPWTTALLAFALLETDCGTAHAAAIRRAGDWLLAHQLEDGSWWQESRSWPLQPHFDAGFPHGKDQWISAAATALAVVVLLAEEPVQHARDAFESAERLAARHPSPIDVAAAGSAAIGTGEVAAGEVPTFAVDVLPIFQASCTRCHSADASKGGLVLTNRAGVLAGGQSGEPAVVPGDLARSQLLDYVTDRLEDLEMPPLDQRDRSPKLTEAQVQILRRWIENGAH